MPSTSTQPSVGLTAMTWLKLLRSRRHLAPWMRSRNKFDVRLLNPSGAELPLCRAFSEETSEAVRASCREASSFIEMHPAHWIAGWRDVAFTEDNLEQMRVSGRRAEHFGTTDEVYTPDSTKTFVEAHRVECADRVPATLEALGPGVQSRRV